MRCAQRLDLEFKKVPHTYTFSFIGLGVQIPTATWGNMMNAAQSMHILRNVPWLWVPPGLAISMTVIAVNFVGDGLRDALDPRSGTSV